jgi:hypothetical protein
MKVSSSPVMQMTRLWYKEWFFMLTQRESRFNSCPLSFLPNDHSNPIFFSAGHFPIGEPLTNLPQMTWLTGSPAGDTLNSFKYSSNAGPKIIFKDSRNVNAEVEVSWPQPTTYSDPTWGQATMTEMVVESNEKGLHW